MYDPTKPISASNPAPSKGTRARFVEPAGPDIMVNNTDTQPTGKPAKKVSTKKPVPTVDTGANPK